jgi:hypothetical protein
MALEVAEKKYNQKIIYKRNHSATMSELRYEANKLTEIPHIDNIIFDYLEDVNLTLEYINHGCRDDGETIKDLIELGYPPDYNAESDTSDNEEDEYNYYVNNIDSPYAGVTLVDGRARIFYDHHHYHHSI